MGSCMMEAPPQAYWWLPNLVLISCAAVSQHIPENCLRMLLRTCDILYEDHVNIRDEILKFC